jgi:hypothetical protein
MRTALFSAIPRDFISGRSEVQLGMAALRLYDLRTFAELSRRAAHGVLLFPFPRRWLIPSIAVVIGHAASSTIAIHELYRGGGFGGLRSGHCSNCQWLRLTDHQKTVSGS